MVLVYKIHHYLDCKWTNDEDKDYCNDDEKCDKKCICLPPMDGFDCNIHGEICDCYIDYCDICEKDYCNICNPIIECDSCDQMICKKCSIGHFKYCMEC